MFSKLTPVLIVESVEACLPFWIDHFGFEKTAAVPEGDAIGFAILKRDNVEIMYQSVESVEKDLGAPVTRLGPSTVLYLEVESLDEIIKRIEEQPITVARRTTFYGMDEIGIREPGGTLVIFASQAKG